MRSSHSARIDACHVAIELAEAGDDCAGHMAGAEHDNPPVAMVVGLKEQLHRAAAGHADVALEIPLYQFRWRHLACRLRQHVPRVLDRLMLDAAASNRTGL